jgi:hypothetical protein
LASTTARSRGWTTSLAGFGALGPTEGRGVSGLGPVAVAAAVTGQLPRHRRRGSSQPGRDLPAGLAGGDAAADLFAFGPAQTSLPAAGWVLLSAAGLEHKGAHRRSPLPSRRAIRRSDSPRRHRRQTRPALLLTAPRTAPTTSTLASPVNAEVMQPPLETASVLRQPPLPRHSASGSRPKLVSESMSHNRRCQRVLRRSAA